MNRIKSIGAGIVLVMAVVAPLFYCMAIFGGYIG